MFEPVKSLAGLGEIYTVEYPLAASQTIKRGMALTPSNGALVAASNSTETRILIAAEDKTTGASETTTKIKVYGPDQILYKVPYKGTTKTVPVAADMFATMDMDADALSIQLDAQASPKAQFTVLGIDTTQKVLFVVINYPNTITVTLPDASATVKGVVKAAALQEDSEATTVELLVADFNALLAALKTAGIMLSA